MISHQTMQMPREKNNKVCVGLTFFAGVEVDGGGRTKKHSLDFSVCVLPAWCKEFIYIFHDHIVHLRVVMTKIPNKSLGFNHLCRISADQLGDYLVVPSHNSRGEKKKITVWHHLLRVSLQWDCNNSKKSRQITIYFTNLKKKDLKPMNYPPGN